MDIEYIYKLIHVINDIKRNARLHDAEDIINLLHDINTLNKLMNYDPHYIQDIQHSVHTINGKFK